MRTRTDFRHETHHQKDRHVNNDSDNDRPTEYIPVFDRRTLKACLYIAGIATFCWVLTQLMNT